MRYVLLYRFLWLVLDPNEAHRCRHEIRCGKHPIYLYNHGPLAGVKEILKHKTSSSYSTYNFKVGIEFMDLYSYLIPVYEIEPLEKLLM